MAQPTMARCSDGRPRRGRAAGQRIGTLSRGATGTVALACRRGRSRTKVPLAPSPGSLPRRACDTETEVALAICSRCSVAMVGGGSGGRLGGPSRAPAGAHMRHVALAQASARLMR